MTIGTDQTDAGYAAIGYISDDGIRVFNDRHNDACCGCRKCARLCHGCDKCDPNNDRGNLHDPRD